MDETKSSSPFHVTVQTWHEHTWENEPASPQLLAGTELLLQLCRLLQASWGLIEGSCARLFLPCTGKSAGSELRRGAYWAPAAHCSSKLPAGDWQGWLAGGQGDPILSSACSCVAGLSIAVTAA